MGIILMPGRGKFDHLRDILSNIVAAYFIQQSGCGQLQRLQRLNLCPAESSIWMLSFLHFPKRGDSNGPSSACCSIGGIRLELWLTCLFLLAVGSKAKGIGGRHPSDTGPCS